MQWIRVCLLGMEEERKERRQEGRAEEGGSGSVLERWAEVMIL